MFCKGDIMFRKIPYSENELRVIEEITGRRGRVTKILNTPVTARMNAEAMFFEKKPFWLPYEGEIGGCIPSLYNDNLGRGGAQDIVDAFGIAWQYVPSAGGSIVHPGAPMMEDANDWKEKVIFPDIDSWDWAKAAEENPIDARMACQMSFINGFWFERLISFMDFMPAAMALIDDEQTDAVKDLFAATTEFGCRLIDKFCEYWPQMDGFNVHDDWGAQKAPFFSMDVAYELFVPYMKQLTDHIHSKGRFATLHSCGHNEERVQCYIDGGFDQWSPQPMNDVKALYENYGDKIIIGVFPERTDIETLSEEEQRAEARKFVDIYSKPGKPAILSLEGMRRTTPAFREEMYIYSRKIFAEQ